MKKIITIVGARPQFIKAASLSRELIKHKNIKEIIVHTGQHYDINMSQIFFDELEIPPIDYLFHTKSTTHGKQTSEMLTSIENVLLKEKPDMVLVYGDTNSTLAGSLAAAKLHIPLAHVEAGLRSYNRKMPEEINRIISDQLSEILFTPTQQAVINLQKEGYPDSRIVKVGDVMYDAAIYYGEKAIEHSQILKELNCENKNYILSTIHRAENTDDVNKLNTIFSALERLSQTMSIIMPLHPRTRKSLNSCHSSLFKHSGITIIEPVGFLDMIMLEKNASLIITDSGGIQKEAFFYQVPCVTIRDETEWIETIELHWNRLTNPLDEDEIIEQALQALNCQGIKDKYPYGKGDAARLIANYLS